MLRNTLGMVASVLCLVVWAAVPALGAAISDDAPVYANPRYGFSFSLPPGHWEVTESANGDGAVLRSSDWAGVEEVRAYGSAGPAALGQNFDAVLKNQAAGLASVGHREVDRGRGLFRLWGEDKEGRSVFLACFLGRQAAHIVRVLGRAGVPAMDFEQVTAEVRRSFRPGP